MLAYLDESRGILTDQMKALLPEAIVSPIEATALSWLDLRAYDDSSDSLDRRLRAAGLVLNKGTVFDRQAGDGFMRLNFACPHDALREGVRRMAKALKS